MVYTGHVKRGRVVFDEPATLAEGTRVRIEVLPVSDAPAPERIPSLAERLAPIIGKARSLPEDAAENHGDYTKWRQTLWEGQDVEAINRAAMAARRAKAEASAGADDAAQP